MELPLKFKISKRDAFYYAIVFLSAGLVLSNVSGIVPLALLAVLSAPLIFNPAAIIPLLYLSSWHNGFLIIPGLTHFFYLFLLIVSLYVTRRKHQYAILWGFPVFIYIAIPLLFWFLWTGFRAVSGDAFPSVRIAASLSLMIIASVLKIENMEFSRKCVVWIALGSTVLFTAIALLHPFYVEHEGSTLRVGPKKATLHLSVMPGVNPNIAARVMALNFVILYAEAFRQKKIWMGAVSMVNLIPVMLCGSRTTMLAMAVVIMLLPVLSRGLNWKNILLGGAVFGILALLYTLGGDLNDQKEMTVDSVVEDGGHGRLITMEGLFTTVIPQHLLAGIGTGRDNFTEMGFGYDADNMYVDVLAQIGLVGFLLFFAWYFAFMRHYLPRRYTYSDKCLARGFLYIFLVMGIGISLVDTYGLYFCFTYLILLRNAEPEYVGTRWRIRFSEGRLTLSKKLQC